MGAAVRVWIVVGLLVACCVPVVPAAGCATPKGVYSGATPWAQRLVDPTAIWPLTKGSGVTVAVVGTGVDGSNAQFGSGQVLPQISLVGGSSGDCDGRGTFAAGIVAAQADPDTTFAGIAPSARILPIRYTESTSDSTQGGDPNVLATAVNRAVDAHAGVILVVVPAAADSPALRSAVQHAHSVGDVVVSPAVGSQAGDRSYPTADPDVLGVGAVNAAGTAVQSESGAYVSLAAPGSDLVSTSAGAGGRIGLTWPVSDPAFSAAYVAGAVTLLRSYRPGMTPDQVVDRLTLTAGRAPGGGHDGKLGWGVLDADAAVSSPLPVDAPGPGVVGAVGQPRSVRALGAPVGGGVGYRWAGLVGLLVVVVAGLVVLGAVTVRRGRARGWRIG